ncbi:MAG: Glutamate--tRNA ligase mitochondrial [Chaenotheca gracillima]|nr:MAG: Glutamate--tRNA ligase mitochondrial [Chaenotheca gracillima]
MLKTWGRAPRKWRAPRKCCLWARGAKLSRGLKSSSKAVPKEPARTRFAPSPTGYLHLGSLRTALFNYLLAKSTGGQFLLRIEDTDQRRTLPDAEKRICEDLRWAGLQWDEGPEVGGPYGPYQQSKRTALYRENAETLLQSGHAYRCFCTSQRLHELATHRSKLGMPTDYDRACLSIPSEESEDRAHKGESHVIRLKVPDRYPDTYDLVYGKTKHASQSSHSIKRGEPAYEDPILLKSDGLPTYHLANVVDDHHMKITHVVRAAEWMSSTPKHLVMYDAFKWKPPAFAHVGLLQNTDNQKLSKRNFDQDVTYFRDTLGIFPEALTNFVALLGWSHDQKSDVFTLQELVQKFTMSFTKGNTVVKDHKLWYLQNAHAKRRVKQNGTEFEEIVDSLLRVAQAHDDISQSPILNSTLQGRDLRSYIAAILQKDTSNYADAKTFVENNTYYFVRPPLGSYETSNSKSTPVHTIPVDRLATAASKLNLISADHWDPQAIKERVEEMIATSSSGSPSPSDTSPGNAPVSTHSQKEWRTGIHHYLRHAIAGGKPGPGIGDVMSILGRDESLERLRIASEEVLDSIKS